MDNIAKQITIAAEDWAAIIKTYRKMFDLTQSDMAEKVGCNRRCVSEWEAQKTFPQKNKQVKLYEIMSPALEDILRKVNAKKTDSQNQSSRDEIDSLSKMLAGYKNVDPLRYELMLDLQSVSEKDLAVIRAIVDKMI